MNESATVAIPNDVIQPIVAARIQAAIVESLKGERQMIETAVTAVLMMKVNADGKRDNYDSYNKYTYLEFMANQCIKEAANEALKEHLENAKADIKKAVLAEMQKRKSIIAAALVDGLANSINSVYGFNLSINLQTKER